MRDQFAMYERFSAPAFGALPESSLRQIRDLDPRLSRLLWSAWVSRNHDHLCTIPARARRAPLARLQLAWREEPAAVLRFLAGLASPGAAVVHFWSPLYAVQTSAALFLRHWDDFWYPSDDNNALVLLGLALRVEFVEEWLSLYRID